jgi:fumarate reductase subunit C
VKEMKYYKDKRNIQEKIRYLKADELPIKERKKFYINQVLMTLAVVLFFIEIIVIIFIFDAIKENLTTFLKVLVGILLFLLPIVFFILHGYLIEKFFSYPTLPKLTKKMIVQVNQKRMKKYKVTENYIITKCFDSSRKEMMDKDILICSQDDVIRIMNDFYHSSYDFGCYQMRLSEMKYQNIKDGDSIQTRIEVGKDYFVFGYRAKTFLDKIQITKK